MPRTFEALLSRAVDPLLLLGRVLLASIFLHEGVVTFHLALPPPRQQ